MGDHIEDEFGNPDTWTVEETILSLEIFKANLTNDRTWFYNNFERLINAAFRDGSINMQEYIQHCWKKVYQELYSGAIMNE